MFQCFLLTSAKMIKFQDGDKLTRIYTAVSYMLIKMMTFRDRGYRRECFLSHIKHGSWSLFQLELTISIILTQIIVFCLTCWTCSYNKTPCTKWTWLVYIVCMYILTQDIQSHLQVNIDEVSLRAWVCCCSNCNKKIILDCYNTY